MWMATIVSRTTDRSPPSLFALSSWKTAPAFRFWVLALADSARRGWKRVFGSWRRFGQIALAQADRARPPWAWASCLLPCATIREGCRELAAIRRHSCLALAWRQTGRHRQNALYTVCHLGKSWEKLFIDSPSGSHTRLHCQSLAALSAAWRQRGCPRRLRFEKRRSIVCHCAFVRSLGESLPGILAAPSEALVC